MSESLGASVGPGPSPTYRPGAVSRFSMKVLVASGGLVAAGAATSPLWVWGRPDRAWGFLIGAAASVARFAWSVHLARRLGRTGPRRYAVLRTTGLAPLAAALVLAGTVDGIDLAATAVGVFVATVASVIAAVLETRRAARGDDS